MVKASILFSLFSSHNNNNNNNNKAHYNHHTCVQLLLFLFLFLSLLPPTLSHNNNNNNNNNRNNNNRNDNRNSNNNNNNINENVIVGMVKDEYLRYAYQDQQIYDGALWWSMWVNERGGLYHDGKRQNITIITMDASTPDPSLVYGKVLAAYESMVKNHNVTIIISPTSTERCLAAINVSERYHIINFVVGGLAEFLDAADAPYVFAINIPAFQMPIPALKTLNGKGAKDYTIFARPDIIAHQVASSAIGFLSANYGMEMKEYVSLNYTSTEAASIQSILREVFKAHLSKDTAPDVLVFCALPSEITNVFVAFHEVQPHVKAAIFSVPVSPFEQQLNRLGNIGDYWIGTTRFYDTFNFGTPGELGGTTAEFIADYLAKIGHHPASLDPMIAAALMSYLNAVDLSQTTNAEVIRATLLSMGRIETFALPILYDLNGTNTEMFEIAIQNKQGFGQFVDEHSLIYPAEWPWTNARDKKADFVNLLLKIILPIACFCFLVATCGLLIARYQSRQAVLALTQAEEGERRNYRLDYKFLNMGSLIGTGSFGNVFRGEYRGADVCIKKLKLQKFNKQQKNLFAKEAGIMVGMRHPNIVLFMGVCLTPPNYCIVTEFMQRGSLFDVIHNDKIQLPLPLILNMLSDILKGLYYIHSAGIIHRDLKSPNLLVDRNWTIKIADFGLSCTKAEAATDAQVSLLWTAPEVLLNEKGCYSEKSDVYSFGIIVWELVARKMPYEGIPVAAISPAVVSFQRPPISLDWHPGIANMIVSCWHSKAEDRPTVKDARAHVQMMTNGLQPQEIEESTTVPANNNLHLCAPSSGLVFFVCTTVQHMVKPWDEDPWGTAKAIKMINEMLRETLKLFGGREVKNDGQSFLFAFSTLNSSLGFSIRVQSAAMNLSWPGSILKFEETSEYRNKAHDLLFRGISLRIGIHHLTDATAERDIGTETVNYYGEGLHTVSKLANMAGRGEIFMNADSYAQLVQPPTNIDPFYVEPIGPKKLDDKKEETISICVALPWPLKGRMFIPQPYYESPLDTTELVTVPESISKVSPHSSSSYLLSSTTSISSAVHLTSSTLATLTRTPAQVLSLLSGAYGIARGEMKVDRDVFLFPHSYVNPWIVDVSEISLGSILDSSRVWEVFAAVLRGNKQVLIQRFLNQKMNDSQLLDLRAETATLKQLRHENVARYLGICLVSKNMCLVLEQTVSSLASVLQNPDNAGLPWQKKFGWAVDIAKGMWFLHNNGIVHTDLKSPNVAFTSDGTLKIVDYGYHRVQTDTQAMTQATTVCWVAPEIFQGHRFSQFSDVYSYGIMLWELIFQAPPWGGQHSMQVVYKVTSGKRPPISHIPANTPKNIVHLMEQCWQQKPGDRPAFVDIIADLDPKILSDV